MILDLRQVESPAELEGDVCVIGAGPAGLTVAHALTGQGLKTVVLEAGGMEYEEESQALYQGRSTGIPYPVDSTRVRVFGGTSWHWAGHCSKLRPFDFQRHAWLPESGWPITAEEIEPYYRQAHQLLELGRYEYGAVNFDSLRLPPPVLDGRFTMLQIWRERLERGKTEALRFGERFAGPLNAARDVDVVLNANVVDLPTNEAGSVVTEVLFRTPEGKAGRARCRQVVLACGGLENPRVLLNATSRVPQGLGNGHGLVGRYFMEHPSSVIGELALNEEGLALIFNYFRNDWIDRTEPSASWSPAMAMSSSFQERERVRSGYYRFWGRSQPSIYGRVPADSAGRLGHLILHFDEILYNVYGRFADRQIARPMDPDKVRVWAQFEQAPNPASRVLLAEETDRFGKRRLGLDWRLSEADQHTLAAMAQALGRESGASGWGRLRLEDWVLDPSAWESREWEWACHHMGTTRMGESERTGVVDRDCRVFGVENLHVAGSSVFPTGGFVNPTETIVALSFRLADRLARLLRG